MDDRYLVALSTYVSFGPARIGLLTKYFGSAKEVWKTSNQKLMEVGLPEKLADGFEKHKRELDIDDYFNRLKSLSITPLTKSHKYYPESLRGLRNSPVVLYVLGNPKILSDISVAIVGSRKMTSYGREVAEKFSAELATVGVVIVSGLAMGVDTVAHKSCLSVGGKTIAVQACGLDQIYPARNTNLAKEIIDKGAIVSEYPLGHPALKINFANRNRIISGLSSAVVVVEGEKKSGTLLTANHAAEQGKSVYAVPGQVTSPLSAAPHWLIANGAKMLTDTRQIFSEIDVQLRVDKNAVESIMPDSPEEEKLIQILSKEEAHLDELARISGLGGPEVSATLTIMELKGMVKNLGKGVYKKL